MKSKHLNIDNLPLTLETYDALRKGLKLGKLKWNCLSKELQDAYHSFDEAEKGTDFEKQLHWETLGKVDYNTST